MRFIHTHNTNDNTTTTTNNNAIIVQISGDVDEDDFNEERLFMQESSELHYNISEVLSALFQVNEHVFYGVFLQHWHEIILNLSHKNCLKEDRQFAFSLITDAIEFGLNRSNQDCAASLFSTILPSIIECCNECEDAELSRAAAYAMGIAFYWHPHASVSYTGSALHALGACVTRHTRTLQRLKASAAASSPDESSYEDMELMTQADVGACLDNAVATVGIIMEQSLMLKLELNYTLLLEHWLSHLPLRYDEV